MCFNSIKNFINVVVKSDISQFHVFWLHKLNNFSLFFFLSIYNHSADYSSLFKFGGDFSDLSGLLLLDFKLLQASNALIFDLLVSGDSALHPRMSDDVRHTWSVNWTQL